MNTEPDPRPKAPPARPHALDGAEILLGVVRGISYGLFRPPDPFVSVARGLGAGLVRVYFYWSQIEPEPDRTTYAIVDDFLGQLDGSERVWVTVCSSSRWATRQSTDFLPPSPAKDPERYRRFVRGLVTRCAGRVHGWQCDNEPSNAGLTWSGTAAEYVGQLRILCDAVGDIDPRAAVILGGAPYALPGAARDSHEWRFVDEVLRDGRDAFDLFDLHLYGFPERIASDVAAVRQMMQAHGYEKPIVAGEYGGPVPDMFPEAAAAIQKAMQDAFAAAGPAAEPNATMRKAVASLYAQMVTLPPQLQMFMAGCSSELESRRHRIACREIVTRNILALAAGVRVAACWKLAPEVSSFEDPTSVMELFYGKLLLMRYGDGRIARREPAGDTFALLAAHLRGAEEVVPLGIETTVDPRVVLFDVRRGERGPLLVAWRRGDPFSGEDEPAVRITCPWPYGRASAVDAFGVPHPIEVRDGRLRMPVSVTPVLVAAASTRE